MAVRAMVQPKGDSVQGVIQRCLACIGRSSTGSDETGNNLWHKRCQVPLQTTIRGWCRRRNSKLSSCLQNQLAILEHKSRLFHFRSGSLLMYLGRQLKMAQMFELHHPGWRPGWRSRLLASTRPGSKYCGHFGSESAQRRVLILPLLLFQINKLNQLCHNTHPSAILQIAAYSHHSSFPGSLY